MKLQRYKPVEAVSRQPLTASIASDGGGASSCASTVPAGAKSPRPHHIALLMSVKKAAVVHSLLLMYRPGILAALGVQLLWVLRLLPSCEQSVERFSRGCDRAGSDVALA